MILCLLVEMVVPVWAKDYQMTMFGIKSDGTTMNTVPYKRRSTLFPRMGEDVWCLLSDVI